MDDEYRIIHSPLERRISERGISVEVLIYRGEDDAGWLLEVVDHAGGSTVWNEPFASGRAALDEALRTIARDGSNYMSRDFQDEIRFLGLESSPSFVREPEGNGVAERFIRTLKENFLWVHTFNTTEELRCALQDFIAHYNATWLVARHGYRTPNQIRAQQRKLAEHQPANLPLVA